ncbi:MAG TPA: hypothetical protein PLP21_14420 [Pyrinomonadaceae bacterium]|nr:hypothetical protein [Pyrinomonadaceae bacterium]
MRILTATIWISVLLLTGCSASKNKIDPARSNGLPTKVLWAWERPEDLHFIDPNEIGVAFLAQTIFLEKDQVSPKPRRQPLEVPPGTYLIAVTRVETKKGTFDRPTFSAEMGSKMVSLIKNTLELPDVKAIQIDFDAVVSERPFYRSMMRELMKTLPPDTPLTMTSLASWCTGDAWFNDFPVDEAVPMAFQMGADSEKIHNFLRAGNDWNEPLCRGSYGISLDEGRLEGMKPGRRLYFFKNAAWQPSDLDKLP